MIAEPVDGWRGVVVLDVDVTEASQQEGWARDVVRLVQNARKEAGLNLTDQISVAIQAHGPLRAAIQQHRGTIQNETLAIRLDLGSELPKDADDVVKGALDGNDIRLTIASTIKTPNSVSSEAGQSGAFES